MFWYLVCRRKWEVDREMYQGGYGIGKPNQSHIQYKTMQYKIEICIEPKPKIGTEALKHNKRKYNYCP